MKIAIKPCVAYEDRHRKSTPGSERIEGGCITVILHSGYVSTPAGSPAGDQRGGEFRYGHGRECFESCWT
jgi:hypothetical protein